MSEPRTTVRLDRLDPLRWRRIEPVLDRALDLEGAARSEFLDRACADDPALRADVEALLAADRSVGSLLDRPLDVTVRSDLPPAAASGRRVGAWRIVSELGRGGMGTVHLAERADGAFEQQVAIKLLRASLAGEDLTGRFLHERRVLARLEHPNIARLLDGGVTADGQPFFAMELVSGEPVTEWCARRHVALPDMLGLFGQVCDAVQFAHQNLIVHRDLKPANIFVSTRGEVKLLDFGVAKLLDPAEGSPEATLTLDRRMTPHYAAPEQIRGEPPTTATDVYALGAVLYELLCGMRPLGRQATRLAEVERAVLEEDPLAPSALLATPGMEPWRRDWRPRVLGDLDAIVLKALRKEPDERYASVEALHDDLARFAGGRTVRAARSTAVYRFGKFVRRNRVVVGALTLALVSLAAGLVGVSHQAERARSEAAKAGQTRAFLLSLFRASDPNLARGDTLTARVLLDRGAERVERELAGQPALQAEMLQELGTIYRQLGLLERAASMFARAVSLRRLALGARADEVAASLTDLGGVLTDLARYDQADRTLREALDIRDRRGAGAARAETVGRMGMLLQARGRYAEAESLYREALRIDERARGPDATAVAGDLDRLGGLLSDRNRPADAVPVYERAVAIQIRRLGRDDLATAKTLEDLADAIGYLGEFARADSLRREVLRVRRSRLGPDHPDVAVSLSNLAGLSIAWRRYPAADSAYREALRIDRLNFGDRHPRTALVVNNMGALALYTGRPERAESLLTAARAVWKAELGADHDRTLHCITFLGTAQRMEGHERVADSLYRAAITGWTRRYDADHFRTSFAYLELGILRTSQRRFAEAETLLRRTVAIRRATANEYPQLYLESLSALGTMLREARRDEDSRVTYREAVDLSRARLSEDPAVMCGDAVVGLGRVLTTMRRYPEAESLLRCGLSGQLRVYGSGDPHTAEARAALGVCLAATGRVQDSRRLLVASLPVLRRQPGRPDPLLAEGMRLCPDCPR